LDDLGVDVRIILYGGSRNKMAGRRMDYLDKHKGKWRAVVIVVMNLRVA
jgi:hypothetical protein